MNPVGFLLSAFFLPSFCESMGVLLKDALHSLVFRYELIGALPIHGRVASSANASDTYTRGNSLVSARSLRPYRVSVHKSSESER
jgi:hypothetical protein